MVQAVLDLRAAYTRTTRLIALFFDNKMKKKSKDKIVIYAMRNLYPAPYRKVPSVNPLSNVGRVLD